MQAKIPIRKKISTDYKVCSRVIESYGLLQMADGTWRIDPAEETIKYAEENGKLNIIQSFGDGSKS